MAAPGFTFPARILQAKIVDYIDYMTYKLRPVHGRITQVSTQNQMTTLTT